MANVEPPPYDENLLNDQDDDDSDDMFKTAKEDSSPSDLFPVNNDILSHADPVSEKPRLEIRKPEDSETDMTVSPESESGDVPVAFSSSQVPATVDVSRTETSKATEQEDDTKAADEYDIDIQVTETQRVGDGMTSYVTYKIITKTTIPAFLRPETIVTRRFSDFLGLYHKLADKHIRNGRIVPPPPEKSMIGTTKMKISKDEAGSSEFIERRKAALERYLRRIAIHPVLRVDPDFRDFLETDGELPKATETSALSGAGVKRLLHKFGDAVEKMTFKMDETDEWFDEKHSQIEALDDQCRKLHANLECLVTNRKELSVNTAAFAKSVAMLGSVEEHTALSQALSQLAEVEEKIEQLHTDQVIVDMFTLAELLKDYIALIGAVREVFRERVKLFRAWKDAEATLLKKREQKTKLEQQNRTDKIPDIQQEISDWEQKVDICEEDFVRVSKIIRNEITRFDKRRVADFKSSIIKYLECLVDSQSQLIKHWERFLPEAKAIA